MLELLVNGNSLTIGGKTYRCAIGKNGFADDKKEGDGKTPVGTFGLRECWYRADLLSEPETKLPLRIIEQDDGWCDDAASPRYNRHVKLPFRYGHENLWREDGRYNLIIPLGYNDENIVPGLGSAIFLHCASPDYVGTEGCVALAQQDLLAILPHLAITSRITIKP